MGENLSSGAKSLSRMLRNEKWKKVRLYLLLIVIILLILLAFLVIMYKKFK
jgi:t-SNARE complex subunit (syntaxin)